MSAFPTLDQILNKNYNSETPDKERSKAFQKEYIKIVKRLCKGYTVHSDGGYCYASGFIESPDGEFCYFNSGDFRFGGMDPFDRVLIRRARDLKDFKGGRNNYCSLEDIGHKAEELFDERF